MKTLKKSLLAIALCNFMLFAFPMAADAMRIYVKNLHGVTLTLEVEQTTKIEEVRKMIFEKTGWIPENMRLLFAGKQLEDSKTLADYNIQKECTIHICIKQVDC